MGSLSTAKNSTYSRNYYRRNKEERLVVHKCPHCQYETTGPKQCIKVHIWSKHTPENKKPFQCPDSKCYRGFASWATLNKHVTKYHKITLPKNIKKKQIFAIIPNIIYNTHYKINIHNRINQYKKYKIINMKKLLNHKYEFSLQNLFYDEANNYISLTTYTRNDIIENYWNKS